MFYFTLEVVGMASSLCRICDNENDAVYPSLLSAWQVADNNNLRQQRKEGIFNRKSQSLGKPHTPVGTVHVLV